LWFDVQEVGNTASGGLTLEKFLDARGSLCYGAHSSCPTDLNDPFDPPSAQYPWLPFITDRCSIPEALVKGPAEVTEWLRSIGVTWPLPFPGARLVHLAPYLRDDPVFGDQTVMFVYACMRHDFNWRNLYRVEHHLKHTDAWNLSTRLKADTRLRYDLLELCNANSDSSKTGAKYFTWRVHRSYIDDCRDAASAIFWGVVAYPMPFVSYGPSEV
jgi:hypothetical protein